MTGRGGEVGPRAAPDWLDGRRQRWTGRRYVEISACSYQGLSGYGFWAGVGYGYTPILRI